MHRKIVLTVVTIVVALSGAPSAALAGSAEAPRLSQRTGCKQLTGTQCNAKRRKIHAAGYPTCHTWSCVKRVKKVRDARARKAYAHEWRYWSRLYIPSCTWQGESGYGPQFAYWRYDLRNGGSHGPPIEGVAHGKYQMMPSTYWAYAKYGDWSRLDQEISAHRLYWAQGTSPWEAC